MGPDTEAVDRLRETPVSRRLVYDGRLIRVFEDQVSLADGVAARREVVEHPGAVAIIAVDDRERLVLVRQWRHPVGRAVWEVPAGTRDRDEPPDTTAARELTEETGYRAGRLTKLGAWPLAPGYSGEVMHFYLATALAAGDASTEHDERIEVGWFDPGEIRQLVARQEIDVKTLAAIALAGWCEDVFHG
jgi:ADP-ribose diphosphatase